MNRLWHLPRGVPSSRNLCREFGIKKERKGKKKEEGREPIITFLTCSLFFREGTKRVKQQWKLLLEEKPSPKGVVESRSFFHDPSPKIVARYIEREESPTRDVDLAMTSDKRENLREESSREGESRQVCVLTYAWGWIEGTRRGCAARKGKWVA